MGLVLMTLKIRAKEAPCFKLLRNVTGDWMNCHGRAMGLQAKQEWIE